MNPPAGDKAMGGEVKVMAAVAIAAIVGVTALVFTADEEGSDKKMAAARKIEAAAKMKGATPEPAAAPAPRKVERRPPPPPPMDPELLAQQRREAKTNDERELAARSETIDNPPEFDTKEDEKQWWQGKLAEAKGLEERRAAAVADLPRHEAMAEKAPNPAKSRALFERKKARLEQQLEQAREQVAKIESKMQGL